MPNSRGAGPPEEGPDTDNNNSDTSPATGRDAADNLTGAGQGGEHTFAGLLDILGFAEGESMSICHRNGKDDPFTPQVCAHRDAPALVEGLPNTADIWFGVCPIRDVSSGRGKAEDVTRLSSLWSDLDIKPGGCETFEVARKIIDDLSIVLDSRPAVITYSGHGLQPYWVISDGAIGEDFTHVEAVRLLDRWKRMVQAVVEIHGAKVDSVYDLPRILRAPGTVNNKGEPVPVVCRADTGEPVTIGHIVRCLDERGVAEPLPAKTTTAGSAEFAADAPKIIQEAMTAGEMSGRVHGRLNAALANCYGSDRHAHVRDDALALLRLGKQGESGVEKALRILLRAFVSAVEEDRAGGEAEALAEFVRFICSERVAQLLSEPDTYQSPADDDERRANSNGQAGGKGRAVDGAAFILNAPEKIPAVWGRDDEVLWPEGEALMIAGGLGLGKTTLAGLLVRALLFGGDVLGLPVLPAGEPILYLAMDRPQQIARSMRRQFTHEHQVRLKDRLIMWPGPLEEDLAKRPELLAELARSFGAAYVFVDSLKDAAIGLSDDEVGAAYNRARQMLIADGCQLCELHHLVKRASGDSVDDAYGSRWLTAGCGSLILLSGEPGDPIVTFRHRRQPAAEVGPYQLLSYQNTGEISICHFVDLIELARAAADSGGLTAKVAACALYEKNEPTRADIEKARRKLDRLTEQGRLIHAEGHRGGGAGEGETRWLPA